MTSATHPVHILTVLLCCLLCACTAELVRNERPQQEQSAKNTIALQFAQTIGSPGNGPGQMLSPMALSIDPEGNIYVADTGNDRILKFDQAGKYVTEVGGFGFDPEQFDEPCDVCATTGLNIYVVDSQNRRLQRFDRQLHYLSSLSNNPHLEASLQFGLPAGLAISSTGDMFVSDQENQRILKLDPFQRSDRSFGDTGSGQGLLRDPTALAVGPDDVIYVCDTGNDRLVLYDLYGEYRRSMGQNVLRSPRGIALDPLGRIYVADTGNDRVVVFDDQGEVLLVFGTRGTSTGSLRSPHDVVLDRNGFLYVLDTDNGRIQKFTVLSR